MLKQKRRQIHVICGRNVETKFYTNFSNKFGLVDKVRPTHQINLFKRIYAENLTVIKSKLTFEKKVIWDYGNDKI